ncbi:ABC transporter ATP-binding protein [Alphaproteobacteria bacterium]|nr:ABC transporter ATP-binding protein [Alphaproteobacteria bacterium]
MNNIALEVKHLSVEFHLRGKKVKAVNNLSWRLEKGNTLGIVGESGCGKSVSSLAILKLIPEPPGKISSGSIIFNGEDIVKVSDKKIRDIRGKKISMIFQEPMTSLNPLMTIGNQISELLVRHFDISKQEIYERTKNILDLVQIPDSDRWMNGYPHEMSGGMRQRVMIAMALVCEPSVLIADEPTTALDVTTQAQILALLNDLQKKLGTAVVMITHDLGVISETADHVIVMYAGEKVEEASVLDLFKKPKHPYTQGLMKAIPNIDQISKSNGKPKRLEEIKGIVPSLHDLPVGCSFANRCSFVMERCKRENPIFEEKSKKHWASCFKDFK